MTKKVWYSVCAVPALRINRKGLLQPCILCSPLPQRRVELMEVAYILPPYSD